MTASALNIASINPAAAAAGAGAAAASASGPLAGFEALMAALFPEAGPVAPTPAAQAGQAIVAAPGDVLLAATEQTDSETAIEAAEVAEAGPDAPTAEIPLTAGDAAAALAASLIATQPAAVEATTTAASDAATDTAAAPTTAFGRHKTKGAPALPAILHANAKAGLVEKAELAAESPDVSAPVAGAALPEPAEAAPQAATARTPPAAPAPATPAPSAPVTPAPVAAAPDAQPDLAAPVATAPVEAPSEVAATDTPVAAGLVARPEAAPAPAPATRTARSERTKPSTEGTEAAEDLKPQEATDKPVHAKAVDGAAKASSAKAEPADAKAADVESALDGPDSAGQTEARAATQAGAPAAETTQAVRGSPETVANLAAQILKKLDGKSSRFDVELDPLGLGKVDVRIEIGAHGRITAAMTFENPQAAQDVKARATELQRMLEQAGFDLTGGMTFDVAGDRGQRQGQAWQDQAETGHAFRGQAFRAALDTAGDAAAAANLGALRLRRGVNLGVDLKI